MIITLVIYERPHRVI